MNQPEILLQFAPDGTVDWLSVGWSEDQALMKRAKELINKGETPQEVIDLLAAAGFEVTVIPFPKEDAQ